MDIKQRYKCVIEINFNGEYQKKVIWGEKIDELCSKAKNQLGVHSVKIYDYKNKGWVVVNWWK